MNIRDDIISEGGEWRMKMDFWSIVDQKEIDLGIRTGISGIVYDIISAMVKTFLNVVFLIVNVGCAFILNIMHLAIVWIVKKVRVRFAIDETFFTNNGTQFGNIINAFKDKLQIIGLSILLLIVIWQLFKIFFQAANLETDDPMKLGIRLIIYGFLVGKSYDIIEYIITNVYAPVGRMLFNLIYDANIIGLKKDMSLTNMVSAILNNLMPVLKLNYEDVESMGNFAVLVQGLILLYIDVNVVSVIIKFAERAVTLFLLTLMSPLTFACGVAKSTRYIFEGWMKSFCGVLVMYFTYNFALIMVILFLYLSEGGMLVINGRYIGFDGQRSLIFSAGVILGLLSLLDQSENLAREFGFGTGGGGISTDTVISKGRNSEGKVKTLWRTAKKVKNGGKSLFRADRRSGMKRQVRGIEKEKGKVDLYKKLAEGDPGNKKYDKKVKENEKKFNRLEKLGKKYDTKNENDIRKLQKKKEEYERRLEERNLKSGNRLKVLGKIDKVNKEINSWEKIQGLKNVANKGRNERKLDELKKGINDKKDQLNKLKKDDEGMELRNRKKELLKQEREQRQMYMNGNLKSDERKAAFMKSIELSKEIKSLDKSIKAHNKDVDMKIESLQKEIVKDASETIRVKGYATSKANSAITKIDKKIKVYDEKIAKLDKEIDKARKEGKDVKDLENRKNILLEKREAAKKSKEKHNNLIKKAAFTSDEKEMDKISYKIKRKFKDTVTADNTKSLLKKSGMKGAEILLTLGGYNPDKLKKNAGMVLGILKKGVAVSEAVNDYTGIYVGMNPIKSIESGLKVATYPARYALKRRKSVRTTTDIKTTAQRNLSLMDIGRGGTERIYNGYMDNQYRIESNRAKIGELEEKKKSYESGSEEYNKIQRKIEQYGRDIDKCTEKNEMYARKARKKLEKYENSIEQLEGTIERRVNSYNMKAEDDIVKRNYENKDSDDSWSGNKETRNLQRKKKDMEDKIEILSKIVSNAVDDKKGMTFIVGSGSSDGGEKK